MLGLLGALDPYKHKVNIGMIDQSRDASAVSLSESKSSQDSGRLVISITNHNLVVSSEICNSQKYEFVFICYSSIISGTAGKFSDQRKSFFQNLCVGLSLGVGAVITMCLCVRA